MGLALTILVYYLIIFHIYAFALEALLWEKPFVMKIFGLTKDAAESSRALATNQGVYNLFIAAGCAWSLMASDPFKQQIQIFFFACIIIAAITAGLTASKRIMLLQGLPALAALLLI